jgi:hypothetical protein
MRSLRAVALNVLSVQVMITLLISIFALTLSTRANRTTHVTRDHNARAVQSQRVADALLTARRQEKEYVLSFSSRKANTSPEADRADWQRAYARLGDELRALDPLLTGEDERQLYDGWQRTYEMYGDALALAAPDRL